jgi:lysine decarboxylase
MLDLTWQLREGAGKHLHHIELLTPEQHGVINHDPCKLLLRVPGIATDQWTDWLEQEQQIAYESVNGCSSLYLANPGLTGDDFKTFFEALHLLDKRSCSGMFNATDSALGKTGIFHLPSVAMTPREAFFARGERVKVQEAVGRIARETIVHCPPGIPVMMPGEIISAEQLLFVTTETIAVVC